MHGSQFKIWLWVLLLAGCAGNVSAHPSDISYLKVKVERQRVELRFTFNVLMLTRFAVVDANQDRVITKVELEAAQPALLAYLGKHIQTRINDRAATLGAARPPECLWPSPDMPHQAVEADYGQRYVDLVFTQDLKEVLADVWLGFDIWRETGPLGTIEATYEQGDLRMQVPFGPGEPDYLYDTGFAVEELFQPPAVVASETPAAELFSSQSGWQRLQPLAWPAVGLALGVLLLVAWLRWRRDV